MWSIVLACHDVISNFATLMTLRFLFGALESVISPGFSLRTGPWHRPSEHAWRYGVWFAGNGAASIVGRLLGYGIRFFHSKLAAWRWLFIVLEW